MNSPVEPKTCSRCGAPLTPGALQGLCPRCLLALNVGTRTEMTADGPGPQGAKAAPAPEPPTLEEIARHFPGLEILELLGRGGMGAVYKARQKQLDRIVALKILPPRSGDDSAFAERFTREAKALARLNHPGIVTLYEFGVVEGEVGRPRSATGGPPDQRRATECAPCPPSPLYFFLMEFVDGVSLGQLLRSSRVSPREALAIVPQICDALQYAHDQGIVHRDIKPDNILLDRRGRVKVADFGLAKLAGAGSEPAAGWEAAGLPSLTEAGKVMGTPQYMSPEQIEAPGEVDHRADIYALGVVFYQMLTGELPGKPLEPPSKKVRIDVRLDEVVLRAMEKEPERRYQQASILKTHVETIAATPAAAPPARSRWRAWKITALIIAAVVVLNCVIAVIALRPALSKSPAPLQFRWVAAAGDTNSPAEWLPEPGDRSGTQKLRVLRGAVLDSDDVESASLAPNTDQPDQKEVAVSLTQRGSRKFAKATAINVGHRLAIVWQGRVISAPTIMHAITGRQVNITGNWIDLPRPPGLLSWWPGENSTADAVGGNNGTVAGSGAFFYGAGMVGQAFVFDGLHRDRVDVGNPASLRLQDFTIEAWIKRSSSTDISLDDNNQDGAVAGEGGIVFGYGRGGYAFGLMNDGRLLLSKIDVDCILSTKAVSDTDWHHVAVTKAGSIAMFYIDGAPASEPISYRTAYYFDTSAAIGSRGDARGGTFFGMVDEPSVYSRALSGSQIQAIYAARQHGKRKLADITETQQLLDALNHRAPGVSSAQSKPASPAKAAR